MAILTESLLRAIERSELDYMTDRMTAVREREGNPEGVELCAFGHAQAFYSRTMGWPAFNTVKGISDEELPLLEEIYKFYKSRGRKPQIEVVPTRAGAPLLSKLHSLGLRQTGFHTSLYADLSEPCEPASRSSDIQIKPLTEAEAQAYAAIHCRGTGLPDEGIPYVADNNRVLMRRPGWLFYMALYQGEPAGVGVLYVKGTTASLTFAATLPELRGRGIHSALLQRRREEAEARGCSLLVSQAAFLSPSQRNMERIGMRIAYTRATWSE
ncbi:GNAT family N-acetyltransferase [Paenibacillus puerhi]|uniref:GNAT family N-acetyltransferase n=1 Tax=Paenibacillus puerhi TaxID=2692622 RepID=UPI001357C91E|nr:GNAT family N-acetyltransferase [Paenibacillus puerhi]